MINYFCLQCNHKICVPDKHAGEKVYCPKCNKVNIVPKPMRENNTTYQEDFNIKENEDYVLEENEASDNIINEKENTIEEYSLHDECNSFPEIPKNKKNYISTGFQQYDVADPTKPCPCCGKTIKELAIQCIYCG